MKKKKKLHVPVTAGLKNRYAMDMHAAYQAACLGRFNVNAFGRLAAALSVVRTALVCHNTPILNAVEALDAALAILHTVRDAGDASDIWEIIEADRPTILHGIEMAEQCIGTLSVGLLSETADQLLQQMTLNT